MALRQLTASPTVDQSNNAVALDVSVFMWWPGNGLIARVNGYIGRLTLDGVFAPISSSEATNWDDNLKGLVGLIGGVPSLMEPYALVARQIVPRMPLNVGGSTSWIELSDRRLRSGYGAVSALYPGTTAWVTEYTFSEPIGDDVLSMGRNGHEVFIYHSHGGQMFLWDATTKLPTSQVWSFGINQVAAVFCQELGVIVSIGSDSMLRVWSTDVVPASVTNPVLISGSTTQNKVATYQVQVLGADSDVVVGINVDWSLTGAGATLLQQQSVTDENGYATVDVLYTGASSTAQITASVTC